ncbi:MAG: hypothetical protein BWY78_00801 [Alphaproteobacteria bacterium ADurb.Bin438]|nr:MAG: hypothetical protein BWY78_00801 [Alphaproteobacteria bacterium ADurb.Bin438]
MLKDLTNKELNETFLKSTIIGSFMGLLAVILSEEQTVFKTKLKESLYAIIFAILTGLITSDLVKRGVISNFIEWALIGFVSFNQKSFRVLINLIFESLTLNPFDTLTKIKELLRK